MSYVEDENGKVFCPCCGYYGGITGEYDICRFCGWEHCNFQLRYPDDDTSANKITIVQAQINFLRTGNSHVPRREGCDIITADDRRSPAWRFYGKPEDMPSD